MTANLWRSLTARFMTLGHPLRDAECMAAVVVINCLWVLTIGGYRAGDAERERWPVPCSLPVLPEAGAGGSCGTVPGRVDRGRILSPCQQGPALPAGCGEYNGIPGGRRIASAARGPAGLVCW